MTNARESVRASRGGGANDAGIETAGEWGVFSSGAVPLPAHAIAYVLAVRVRGHSLAASQHRMAEAPGGEYPDGTAALVEKTLGKGSGIYLNFVPALEEQTFRLLEDTLRSAGVKFPVRLVGEKGRVREVECVRYTNGDATILALQKKLKTSLWEKFRVMLPEAFHVYNMRAGSYLGKTRESPLLELKEAQTAVFGLLPCEVEAVEAWKESRHQLRGKVTLTACNSQEGHAFSRGTS